MVRGKTIFICDECGKVFIAPDIEYKATVYSVPQCCPKCKTIHTMPAGLGIFGRKLNPFRIMYKKIWKCMDK